MMYITAQSIRICSLSYVDTNYSLYYMNDHSVGKTYYNAVIVFTHPNYAYNENFLKQFFLYKHIL